MRRRLRRIVGSGEGNPEVFLARRRSRARKAKAIMVWVRGVAAEDAVRSEQPQVAGLGDRLVWQGRDVVGVRQAAGVGERVEKLLEEAGVCFERTAEVPKAVVFDRARVPGCGRECEERELLDLGLER